MSEFLFIIIHSFKYFLLNRSLKAIAFGLPENNDKHVTIATRKSQSLKWYDQ
jgi:hypothetical protein